jgi:phospho-N-acetylmuramoyl-pentapeptide-transferase
MLYYFFYSLHGLISGFNIFRYITFRSAMAALTSFLISLIFGPPLIRKLKELKLGEKINKDDSPRLDDLHRHKQNTPTMGGLLVLGAIIISTVLWADILNRFVIIVLAVSIWLGITGFLDDYLKQVKKKAKGLSGRAKLFSQVILGLILGAVLYLGPDNYARIDVPFLKNVSWGLGAFYIIFVALVITASSNAVNLTDGLDGLAIGIVIMVTFAYSILSYVSGHLKFSEYLLIPYIHNAGELTVFCSSILGAGLGFLWFNCYPASVFMGDVGSLALGGALGAVAVLIKKELLLLLVGGIFVLETASVILQIASLKTFKKRVFKIAPLHHHFEFLDWPENKVIVRFWILAALLALFTVVTLKIR